MTLKVCTYEDCGRAIQSRGLCQSHYWQMRRGEELRPIRAMGGSRANVQAVPCSVPACERLARSKGLCVPHRRQQKRGHELGPVRGDHQGSCAVLGCGRRVTSKHLCQTHAKYQAQGKELAPILPPKHRYVDTHGYTRIKDPDHPNAGKNGLVGEHTRVMSAHIGRALLSHEEVHHKNGDRSDNRLSNLELWSTSQPRGQRVADKLEWAREIIALYG